MENLKYELTGEFIELKNLLKLMGVCESGGAAKMLIAAGEVLVDGEVELRKGRKIRKGQSVQTPQTCIVVSAAS
jgi:ribosome-associated protein